MKRLLTIAGLLISLACGFFFFRSVAVHWDVFTHMKWAKWVWPALALTLILYIGTYALVTFAWGRSLKALGYPLGYRVMLQILLLSQFAKYLPGNVGHHVGRVLLAKREGLPTEIVLGSMLMDTMLVLFAAFAASFPALHLLIQVASDKGSANTRTVAILIAAFVAFPGIVMLLPAARRMVIRQLGHIAQLVRREKFPLLAAAWSTHCASFLIGGTALYLLCIAFSGNFSAPYWIDTTGVYAAAWLLGFLIPGAPAGLGIREIILLLGLSPLFGIEAATAAAAALRLITTIGDGLAFVLGLILRNMQRGIQSNAHSDSI
ncbi:lysylphosphatidylglycerol synthase domain-containing protein [Rhodanobacter sp. T12-5]|uniref:lysylphosphatidylglycerol synthase domain-containing protein n=1 Tax=Rhodanobacter sp. T12-5 TaxID=2024611 RepID=UPI0011EE99E2|nr:lysylphosphatidylglycerol synthase domain-containing protein [Rhodanobacter sp. T12-5]KAA0072054.1 UPF0104 family protein [Rhodanobacter sp. T12-5]